MDGKELKLPKMQVLTETTLKYIATLEGFIEELEGRIKPIMRRETEQVVSRKEEGELPGPDNDLDAYAERVNSEINRVSNKVRAIYDKVVL